MIELALVVCLTSSPQTCKDVGLVYAAENLTARRCVMGAAPEVAKWADTHPGWTVKRWTCRPAGSVAKI